MDIEVMYNSQYGGFGFSQKAIDEYNELRIAADPNYNLIDRHQARYISRTNPIMISIVKRLGNDANGRYADIHVGKIPVIYKDYYKIEECEGQETVIIKYY